MEKALVGQALTRLFPRYYLESRFTLFECGSMWNTTFTKTEQLRRIIGQIKACRRQYGLDVGDQVINLWLLQRLSTADFAYWMQLQAELETLIPAEQA